MAGKLGILKEFVVFLREQKLWYILPIFVILALLSVVIVMAEGSALAPFIYALF